MGTGIEMFGGRDTYRGKYNITVDGVLVADRLEAYSEERGFSTLIFGKYDLPNGEHTIVVENVAANDVTGENMLELDYFRVINQPGVSFEATLDAQTGKVTFGFDNTAGVDQEVRFLVAVYGKGGVLEFVDNSAVTVSRLSYGRSDISIDIGKYGTEGYVIKAFAWDDIFCPLAQSVVVN